MKKPLLVFLVLFALLTVGMAIFIATFDVDRYRPMLASRLQEAIHRPVTLERISLGWRGGIAVQIQGLRISDDVSAQPEPLMHLESASALVRLLPLFRKEVQVASVILRRPRIHVGRDAQGRINALGLAAAAGPAAASSRSAAVGDAAVSFNIASLRIEDGVLHWTDALASPPAEVWVKQLEVTASPMASGRPMDVDIKGALAAEVSNFRLSGRVTLPGRAQQGSVEHGRFAIAGLQLERVLPAVRQTEPHLRGKLAVTVEGDVKTLDPAQLSRSATGSGSLKLAEPVIVNLNILREVFDRFSMLPGLVQALEARLPPAYQAKLAASDTVLGPIDVDFQLEAGSLRFDDLRVRADAFGLTGTGRIGVDGAVDIRATLRIEPALSAALVTGVKELQALVTRSGEMEIPLAIQGQAPRIAVLPDLQYVASRVLVTKAVDLLGKFLQKDEPAGGEAHPGQTEGSAGGILGQLLQKAIKRSSPSDAPPASH